MSFFDEAMAWGMEQEEEYAEEFDQLVREQRAIWTPRDVFDTCCTKWLVNGPEDKSNDAHLQKHLYDWNDGNVASLGCDNCSLAHPTINLSFDSKRGVTVATISHLLDPFVRCMEGLMTNGSAQKVSEKVYRLDGYIRENVPKIRRGNSDIGKHLVRLTKRDLKASDMAQKAAFKAKKASTKAKRSIDKSTAECAVNKKAKKEEETGASTTAAKPDQDCKVAAKKNL